MGEYIKIEAKRLLHTLPGFLLALAAILLLGMFTILLAGQFLPEALEVKPFRIGLCVEGSDSMSNYVREYVQQMGSTEDLMEFCEMQSGEMEEALQNGILTAGIIIPERTAESIMDGTNIPIRVVMSGGTDTAERYLQKKLLALLTECGAVMIDVPQAETLLLYEMQAADPVEIGNVIDLFHFGLVIDRENWFEKETISAFGSVDVETYYLAAGLTLAYLFWGLGSGSFFREQEGNLPVLLERRGIPLVFQQGTRQALFILLYLVPGLVMICICGAGSAVLPVLVCAVMLSAQCGFFFQLAPTTGSGILLNGVWGLAGFFGAGGILPVIFLPERLTKICDLLPAGICMEIFQRTLGGKRGTGWQSAGPGILWCFLFLAGGQFIFCVRQRRKKRK